MTEGSQFDTVSDPRRGMGCKTAAMPDMPEIDIPGDFSPTLAFSDHQCVLLRSRDSLKDR